MDTKAKGILLITLLIPIPVLAQDVDETSPEPAVSSQSLEAMASRRSNEGDAADPNAEQVEPATGFASEAMDEIELGRIEITGNQELPKMLYIVPWKKSEAGDLVTRPGSTALEDVLDPIERKEFVRQVDYYGDLYRDEEE